MSVEKLTVAEVVVARDGFRQHEVVLARKDRIDPGHEAEGLIGETEEVPARRKPDDRARHEDPGRGDHPDGLVDRHIGLLRQGSALYL